MIACYPNPAKDILFADFSLVQPETIQFEILNAQGKVVHRISGSHYPPGEGQTRIALKALSTGVYTLLLRDSHRRILDSRRIVVVEE